MFYNVIYFNSLIVLNLLFLCTAVHVILSFSLLYPIFFIFCHCQGWMERQEVDGERKDEKRRPEKRELHELPYTKLVKPGTIRQ